MEKEKLVSLVKAVQRGNEAAAGDLYDAFYDGIYYFILKSVDNDPELAADLTQDTFMEILETIGKLQEPAAFVTWSKQIAYHKCTAYFRKRRELLLDEAEDGYSAFDTVEEERTEFIPDAAMDQEDFRRTIQDMINELPGEQRSALVLRYFNEISVKEIAQIQGVSEGTVKSRLNYARKAIQQAVEGYEKKNGIRLHIAGVVPMLLWFFRACRRGTGMAITSGTAGAVYTGLGSSGSASAAAVSTGAAAAAATGAKAGIAAATKVAATKIVAAVAAAAVAVTGVSVAVTKLLNKPKPEVWSGYVQEHQIEDYWVGTPEDGHPERKVTLLENGQMHFRLELLEAQEYAYTGNLTVTWEDGEVYHTPCLLTDFDGSGDDDCYELHIDPMYSRSETDEEAEFVSDYHLYLDFTYNKESDTAAINLIGINYQFTGELTREDSGKTMLLSSPIKEMPLPVTVSQKGPMYQYMKRMDGSYGWVPDKEAEAIDEYYADPVPPGEYPRGYQTVVYMRQPDSNEVIAHIGITRQYRDPLTHAVIEEEVDGMRVTRIRYSSGRDMQSVDIPDSVVIIEDGAFSFCPMLKKVEIPGSVRHIGFGAFMGCDALETVKFDEGVETIGDGAFRHSNALKKITLPEGLKTVGYFPFENCASLEEVTLPSTLVEIKDYLFYGCPNLEKLEVAEGNPKYHSSGNCIIETETKTLFAGCRESRIPDDGSVTAIGRYAFAGNTGLTELTVPEGVTEIRYCAFVKSGLREIYLPRSLETIDDQAFKFCEELQDIYYAGTKEEFASIQGIRWDGTYHDFRFIIHCTDGDLTVG